jgi:hypothetical protein
MNSVFDVTISKNTIARKLNRSKFDSLMAKPEIAQAKQMVGGGIRNFIHHNYSPSRPVKKSDNDMIKLSADKKTVTIKYDLIENV